MNVEKVVKPPQNAVTNTSFHCAGRWPDEAMPVSSPMSRQPMTFTANVAHGNEPHATADVVISLFCSRAAKYLIPPPKKLPMLTNNSSFIVFFFFFGCKGNIKN